MQGSDLMDSEREKEIDLIEFSDDGLRCETEQESDKSRAADERLTQGTYNPSLGDTLKETLRDAPSKTHNWMADKGHHTVHYENFTFSVTCQHGNPESINRKLIEDLRRWHESHPSCLPPVSQTAVNVSKDPYDGNIKYYGDSHDQFDVSIFQIFARSTESNAKQLSALYSLKVLQKRGQSGKPVHVTCWHSRNRHPVAWAFTWNSENEGFNLRPLALVMFVKPGELESDRLAREQVYEACWVGILCGKDKLRINAKLAERAKGWSNKRIGNTRFTESSGTEAGSSRPGKRVKRQQDSFKLNEPSAQNKEELPKLLTSMRVKLVSKDGNQVRVFLLEGCDSKTFFDKARGFFGVTDTSKELSFVCEVPGMEHQRYIGDNCVDEFEIFFHDVQKLRKVPARQDYIEITVKPVVCERK